ncbi:MAG: toll/interleukin-1 receptor domain-containing protein, partial [Candidatus Korobacteraceae bacterium]
LDSADLSGANLEGATLLRADLSTAICKAARFKNASLFEAELGDVDLRLSDLSNANLRKARLVQADLRKAVLSGANLSQAHVGSTSFTDVDLSNVMGLDTVKHNGPSTIGIDTIYKSNGRIPEVFLRGCGVPDEFIAYIGSMVGRPIEFYSCFISYSSKDQEFADRLYADLQAKGVRCWFAPHDIQGGRKIHEQIDDAIRLHDKLLLILSEHSMSSNWVKTEIANARQREEQEKKNLLFPITLAAMEEVKKWKLFDADRGIDSAREVREYFIPDFSRWKEHDSYQAALGKLVGDLKAG